MNKDRGDNFDITLPEDDRIPTESRDEIIDRLRAGRGADPSRVAELSREMRALHNAYRKELVEIIGEEKYAKLRELLEIERSALRNKRHSQQESGSGPANGDDPLLSTHWRDKSLGHALELGVDLAQVYTVKREFTERVDALVRRFHHHTSGGVIWVDIGLEDEAVRRIKRLFAWTSFTPPYTGSDSSCHVSLETGGFDMSHTKHLDPAAGLVGNTLDVHNGDAGDFDTVFWECDSSLLFLYQVPRAGLIEVWIEAQSGKSQHKLGLRDEWGFSDCTMHQENSIIARFTPLSGTMGEIRRFTMSTLDAKGTSGSFNESGFVDGETHHVRILSERPFAAGQVIIIEAGMRNQTGGLSNDVEVFSTIDFRYFFKAVRARVLP